MPARIDVFGGFPGPLYWGDSPVRSFQFFDNPSLPGNDCLGYGRVPVRCPTFLTCSAIWVTARRPAHRCGRMRESRCPELGQARDRMTSQRRCKILPRTYSRSCSTRFAPPTSRWSAEGLLPAGIDQSRVQVEPPREAGAWRHRHQRRHGAGQGCRPASRASSPRRWRPQLRRDQLVAKVEVAGPGFINLTLKPVRLVRRAARGAGRGRGLRPQHRGGG